VGRGNVTEMDVDENGGRLRGVFIKDTAVISKAGNMHGVTTESPPMLLACERISFVFFILHYSRVGK
jgi:hypothetical protein